MNGNKFLQPLTIFFLILCSLSVAVSAQSKKDRSKAKELQDEADKSFAQKSYSEAAAKYGQAILLVPTNPNAHYWKAVSHYYLKENEPAKYEFQLALNQGYKPLEIYRIRWFMFYDQKDYDAALSDLNKGLQIEPRNPTFLNGVGDIYAAKNQFLEALAAYQRGITASPKDGDLYYNIARVQAAMGNVKDQGAAANAAINNGTRMTGEAYYLLADSAWKQKDIPAAIAAYQRSISAKPANYDAYRNLANVFRNQSRFSEAIDILKKALLQFAADGNIYNELSRLYSLVGRPEDGVQAALAGIRYQPTQYIGYTNLCRAYNEIKKYQEAIKACSDALIRNPGDGETYFYMGNAYLQQDKAAEATRTYRLAVTGLVDYTTKNPDNADGWYLLGGAYFGDNQRDKAIESYLKCLSISPSFAKARFNLGFIYRVKKDKAAATEQYNILMKLDPSLAAKLKAEIDKM